jgi:hypothetical protein
MTLLAEFSFAIELARGRIVEEFEVFVPEYWRHGCLPVGRR